MMKKMLALAIAILLLGIQCAGLTESQNVELVSGDFSYVILNDNEVQITGYSRDSETLLIPDMIDGRTVTSINFNPGAYDFESIRLPAGLKEWVHFSASPSAPMHCWNHLMEITIPDENPYLEVIDSALYTRENRTLVLYPEANTAEEVTVAEGTIAIQDFALYNCKNIRSIRLPESISSIGVRAFSGCKKLEEINFPSSLTSIGMGAFAYCENVKSLTLPEGITEISQECFFSCANLETIRLPAGLKSIGKEAFSRCKYTETVTLPEGIERIDDYAFMGCNHIVSMNLPGSLTSIGERVFQGLDYSTPGYDYIPFYSLMLIVEKDSYAEKYCQENNLEYDYSGQTGDAFMVSPLSDGTVEISKYNGNDAYVTVPAAIDGKTVTRIGNSAFDAFGFSEAHLIGIILPDSVTSIGDSAFRYQEHLVSIQLPPNLESIGEEAFSDCKKLKEIHLPDSVISIGESAFSSCESLEEIVLPPKLTAIPGFMFMHCTHLKSVSLPDGITSIGMRAFESCRSLQSITLPGGIKSIGIIAFSSCEALQEITIPESVTDIAAGAFSGCSSLTLCVYPGSKGEEYVTGAGFSGRYKFLEPSN